MKQVITVTNILSTKNDQIKQLELKAVVEKPASANPVSFFLKGVQNVGPNTETRPFYQSVSTDFIAEKNISIGCDFGKSIGFPSARLVVTETFVQGSWTNKDGSTGYQSPKINPKTGQVLTAGGKQIYRNISLDLQGNVEDTYIAHDNIPVSTQVQASSLKSQATDLTTMVTDDVTLPA